MPQLPGGRHVGVKFDSDFAAALNSPETDVRSVWMFMPVKRAEDMFSWVRILWLLPPESAANPIADCSKGSMAGSLPIPGDLVECDTGYRLHQKDVLMQSWPAEDRAAFDAFLNDRIKPLMLGPALEDINAWKAWIPTSTSMVMRMSYLWWLGGCHPAQEEQWQYDDPAPEQIDTYDLLATLDHFARLTQSQNRKGELPNGCIRLWTFIDNLHHIYPALQEDENSSIKEQASHWRNNELLDHLDESEAEMLKQQAICEAIALWEGSTDDHLRKLDLAGWKILQLVVILNDVNGL